MNKQELIGDVATASGLSKGDASKAVESVFDSITAALRKGDEVRLVGDLLRGAAGTDARLDLTRAQRPCSSGAQLLELRPVATHGRAQRLVDAQAEALTVRRGKHEMLAVVVQSYQLELTHPTSRYSGTRLPPKRLDRR